MRDTNTGQLRANLMDWIHYTDYGIRILAKEIKKSLYSSSNFDNKHLQCIAKLPIEQPPSTESQYSWLH